MAVPGETDSPKSNKVGETPEEYPATKSHSSTATAVDPSGSQTGAKRAVGADGDAGLYTLGLCCYVLELLSSSVIHGVGPWYGQSCCVRGCWYASNYSRKVFVAWNTYPLVRTQIVA